ncbi:hypothetical protein NBRC111894_2001 [Sporolactobacillus inulinus]|uniref:Uncharacterized protein n=1 Tax=Sporolactobacillus inulinus TaxID=2078 RepID=A0A4Y1ZBK5_9BACL|nr:hypothetical protein NBRC111894_2001 [Sporolactobacillus inulinus]
MLRTWLINGINLRKRKNPQANCGLSLRINKDARQWERRNRRKTYGET